MKGILFMSLMLGLPATAPKLGEVGDRADRLITITGTRTAPLIAEYSLDDGTTWHAATIYPGATIDEWRTCDFTRWNQAALDGRVPAGNQACLWNYFFDVPMPADAARLRLRAVEGEAVALEQNVNLGPARDVAVIDARHAASLPAPWTLAPAGKKTPAAESTTCSVEDRHAPPLVLTPKLSGWHRIYVGMEPYAACEISLTGEDIRYPVPSYLNTSGRRDRFMQEYYLKSADMTGQDVRIALGGVRFWRDPSIRHIRFVPMTVAEVQQFHRVRELAATKGRPFVGYVEPVEGGYHQADAFTLRSYMRNEMRLNKDRGATDVYVHMIRVGIRAWYHSDVVERCDFGSEEAFRAAIQRTRDAFGGTVKAKWKPDAWAGQRGWDAWMGQDDPMAVALEEGHAVGLKVFADMGVNVTHIVDAPQWTDRFVINNPDCLSAHPMFMDFRKPHVRDYVVSVARELLTKYDVDGLNVDFARWGYRKAYDEASLNDVMKRIDAARREAEKKWGRPIVLATRIPSYLYAQDPNHVHYGGEHPWFTAALKTWAHSGWVDRVMPCISWAKVADLSMQRYLDAIAGTDVELFGDLYGPLHTGRPHSYYLDAARKWTREGLDGGFFFYTFDRPTDCERLNWMLRLIDQPDVDVEPGD